MPYYFLRQRVAGADMRRRTIPSVAESLEALAEAGVHDAPREGPNEEDLRGLLDLAAYVAEHRKRVSFPGFTWSDPRFVAEDEKVRMTVVYATLPGDTAEALRWALEGNLARAAAPHTLLALDAHATTAREFELTHRLYGEVTLFSWPHKPPEPADPRIDEARERGWAKALKEHNLLPGRGIVVLDEHQGILLRDPACDSLLGVMALMSDGQTHLLWNPFVKKEWNDSELQYWLGWGPGGPSSAWKELLRVDEAGGAPPSG